MSLDWRGIDPNQLVPQFRADIQDLLDASPYAWVVTYGFRSWAFQAALWDKYQHGGPKAAPPGRSPHNFGCAVDAALDGNPTMPGLQPDYQTEHPGWQWLFEAVAAHPRLHSGRSFQDADHIESTNWKAIAASAVTRNV